MKKSLVLVAVLSVSAFWQDRAEAVPVPCLFCGSTSLAGAGVDGTVSFAVIPGATFNAEIATHGIGFLGAVPSGTLGPVVLPAPTDFVYLYQLANDGPSTDFLTSWSIGGGAVGPAGITAGTRLESTLFVDPTAGLVSAGPAGATSGLAPAGLVDFENGLGPALAGNPVPPWGPCLGSGAFGVQCSDGQADLLASVLVSNWQETPSGALGTPGGTGNFLDPGWTGSVIWFASPFGPGTGSTSITDGVAVASGSVPVPFAAPEPGALALVGLGLVVGGVARRRRSARGSGSGS